MTKKQKQMKRARTKAWSPEARAKRAATRAARLAGVIDGGPGRPRVASGPPRKDRDHIKDVIVFLEHAEKAILKSGAKRITAGESYAMLALTTLRGN